MEEARRNMENGFRAGPKDIGDQYESELRETKEALGEAHLQIYALKSSSACSTRTRTREVAAGGTGPGRACGITFQAMPVAEPSTPDGLLQAQGSSACHQS